MITYNVDGVKMPKIKKRDTSAWIGKVAASHGCKVGEKGYMFVDDEKILEVNNEYLGHDYYPDVITFDYDDNKFDNLFSSCPCIQAGLVLVAKPLLWGHLVFERAAFPAIGNGRKRPGAEALLFQSEPLPTFLLIPDAGNGWHIVLFQPAIHDFQIRIGVRLLAAGIRK